MTIAVGSCVVATIGVPTAASFVGLATGATATLVGRAALGSSFNVAAAAGSSASAAAIIAANTSKTFIGSAVGAAAGGLSSGVAAWMVGTFGSVLGNVVVGTERKDEEISSSSWTFDCWKPVVRDDSTSPSRGRALWDLVADDRIKSVCFDALEEEQLPVVSITNVWDETFEIQWLVLDSGMLSAHAVKI